MIDQAEGLRRLMGKNQGSKKTRVIAVSSGKVELVKQTFLLIWG
jgi:hypothetical protein